MYDIFETDKRSLPFSGGMYIAHDTLKYEWSICKQESMFVDWYTMCCGEDDVSDLFNQSTSFCQFISRPKNERYSPKSVAL